MIRISKRIERLPLGPIAALLLGGAVAFFCFAMPGEILTRLVEASGLPEMLPAAQPPLGDTARALVSAGGGIGAFLIVLAGFLLSGRARRPRNEDAVEYVSAARSASAAPDMPARRPIFAASDFGTPFELTDSLPEAEPVEHAWRFESEEEADADTDPAARPADPPAYAAPSASMVSMPVEARVQTITALMARLEAGLARRRAAQSADGVPADEALVTPIKPGIEAPTGSPARSDDPLREALDQLQRMAQGR